MAMYGAIPYPFTHSRRNNIRTYGMHYHFGGWLCFEYQRKRMRRQWRKIARRENKRWISQERELAA